MNILVIYNNQIKSNVSFTPEFTSAINEVLEARELIKISVLQNCMDDPKELAQILESDFSELLFGSNFFINSVDSSCR